MATLKDLFGYSKSPDLKEKVAAACWRAAKSIFTEADSTENHAQRLSWALRALRAKDSEDPVYSEMLTALVTIKDTDQIADEDIEITVLDIVDKFALAGV